ncbi:hypothetical protein [Dechloromonas sp.]|uniref:hypothetical protein n=1 Tax=Dechloromonas sp. TaxID=1917218 RepID=UPI00263F96D4|nr:hypothetical protein [Dechloromonas sp.]
MWAGVKKSYAGVGGIFARYWRAYGGSRALFSSPYLHVSILLAGAMYPFWLRESWWDTALSTLPNVLGFTLAGFTIWLGFGDEKFRALISRAKPDRESPFILKTAVTRYRLHDLFASGGFSVVRWPRWCA